MRTALERINKAEYIFRPGQLLKRLSFVQSNNTEEICDLPWNYKLKIKTQDNIGRAVWNLGLYDLIVSEVLARLSQTAPKHSIMIDAGANIGHMSSIMDCFSPESSRLFSYEPHPVVYQQLIANIKLWPTQNKTHPVNKALSETKGECDFFTPAGFNENQGLGFIASKANEHLINQSERLAKVEMTTLDEEHNEKTIHLIKIDTEGSELLVLKGAQKLLNEKRIHNIVFEDHELYPTALTTFLEKNGFTLFALQRALLGPKLAPAHQNRKETWEPNSFLATLYPSEISKIIGKKGWIALN